MSLCSEAQFPQYVMSLARTLACTPLLKQYRSLESHDLYSVDLLITIAKVAFLKPRFTSILLQCREIIVSGYASVYKYGVKLKAEMEVTIITRVPVATIPIQWGSLFADARVLNIGASFTSFSIACVSFEVSQLLAQSWGSRRVVGVDIDDALVLKAWRAGALSRTTNPPLSLRHPPAHPH
ncbi:hypothetical protein EDB83DRAFT_2313534 [Lactarius deliciosus]|nr:hypothetical protein EDB83DRAFT_2313534 [Lactarius deliciosus]